MLEKSDCTAHDVPMGEESPRLSIASVGSNDQASNATLSDCSDFADVQRPVSTYSTISSGSGSVSSGDNILPSGVVPPCVPIEDNVDLDLTPAANSKESQGSNFAQASSHYSQENSRNAVNNNNNNSSICNTFSPFAAITMAPNPELTYLDRVVMEIIETERMYVRDLRIIVEDYLAHIIDTGILPIKPEQVCALFGNIEDIYEFNSELLQSLDMCDNDPVAIARCFVIKCEYFDIYTQYCTNYPKGSDTFDANSCFEFEFVSNQSCHFRRRVLFPFKELGLHNSVAALTECMRNKALAKFFRERQATLNRSLPLGSYLLKPVQRILKYHLLLQEIAKHFDPNEEGYEVVEEAIYTMTGVAWYINDMKRKHEHAVRLQEIQSLLINWKGPDLTTYGELVLEGTFRVLHAKNERTLFLFDRILLITKRRGEHYVYKTHISCSTLMLIESAKNSLCFSVTHYKHPKQPHTIQARTLEEKKLWAHHIKRLILENHQAVIPQKAKEAILQMDSIYKKYKYSPERLKKPTSCQSEEFSNSKQAQQSEPSKETLNTTAILKLSGSEESLAADKWPLQATTSVRTLGLCKSSGEELALREEYFIEALNPSDNEEQVCSSSSMKGRLTHKKEDEVEVEENDSDNVLMEDNQEEKEEFGESDFKRENGQSAEQLEAYLNVEKCLSDQDKSQNLQTATYWGSTEKLNPDTFCDPESIKMNQQIPNIQNLMSPKEKDDQKSPKDEAEEGMPSVQVNDTPGDSSEEEGDVEAKPDSRSILPSSVLDKASAIAEHFVCNVQHSSVSIDEMRSLGCLSPHHLNRSGSILSLGDACEHQQRLTSTCSESCGISLTQEALASVDFVIGSSGEDGLFDSDRSIHRRRDSVLSRQDQLLINKIRNYYENAEHLDATFGLKRRESLSYIPSGLVRNSVSRLNSIPKDKSLDLEKTSGPDNIHSLAKESLLVTSAPSETNSSANSAFLVEPVISASTDLNSFNPNVDCLVKTQSIDSQTENDQEEIFRPSSEMIKVWQDMEKEVTRCQDVKALMPREHPFCEGTNHSLLRKAPNYDPKKTEAKANNGLIIFENSDLSTIREESSTLLPLKEKGNNAASENNDIKCGSEEHEGKALRALAPQIGTQSTEDGDLTQKKVLHLARKYSQRIKCTQPLLPQRSQEVGDTWLTKRNLLPVLEEKPEKEAKGKPDLMLFMVPYDGADCNRDQKAKVMTSSTVYTPNSVSSQIKSNQMIDNSPKVLSPNLSHSISPLTPTSPENFNWPDVRELRSKYAHLSSASSQPLVGQERSVTERMLDSNSTRRSSCSSSCLVTSNASTDSSIHKFQRAGSLDQKLGDLRLQSKNPGTGYYVSAQATLPNDKNIIVIEKVPEVTPPLETDLPTEECKDKEITMNGTDNGYIQIRSPTSHEKISIMAVIDRCRAYQESEEYRLREEGAYNTEQLPKTERCKKTETCSSCSEHSSEDVVKNQLDSGKRDDTSQQSMVKNLREKFQNIK